MAKIIDLDDVIAPPKRVKLGGEVYELPPDLPVELYLWIQRLNERDPEVLGMSEREMAEKLYGEVLDLFRYKRPDLERLPIRLSQLLQVVGRVYGEAAEESEDEVRPTRPSRSGGATKTGPSRTRTRSRR